MNRYIFLLVSGRYIEQWADDIRTALQLAEEQAQGIVIWGKRWTDPNTYRPSSPSAVFQSLKTVAPEWKATA
jgi:hypothetical protein